MYAMNLRSVITATSMVATILLTTLNRGIHRQELIDKVCWIQKEIVDRGGFVTHIFQTENTSNIVDRALRTLKDLLLKQHKIKLYIIFVMSLGWN